MLKIGIMCIICTTTSALMALDPSQGYIYSRVSYYIFPSHIRSRETTAHYAVMNENRKFCEKSCRYGYIFFSFFTLFGTCGGIKRSQDLMEQQWLYQLSMPPGEIRHKLFDRSNLDFLHVSW